MAESYNSTYVPPQKKDEWKPQTIIDALAKREALSRLNPESAKDLEKIAKEFMGPEITEFSPEATSQIVESYKNTLGNSIGDYLIGNLGKAASYVGPQRLLPTALALPTKKRTAEKGEELSEGDKKYNDTIKAVLEVQAISEARKAQGGLEGEVEKELAGVNDFSRAFWFSVLGARGIYEHRREKAERTAKKKIAAYGVAKYLADAVKLSDPAEKELREKVQEIIKKQKEEIADLPRKLGIDENSITAMDIGRVVDKYKVEIAKVQEKYKPLRGAREIILNGVSEDMPGLLPLIQDQYKFEEAKKKAEEAKRAAEAKKAA